MASEHSFDVVSTVDFQEVRNAVQQAGKEISTRFDFKGSKTKITLLDEELEVVSSDETRLNSGLDVLKTRLVKRGVSLKVLQPGEIEQALGGTVRQRIRLQVGIPVKKAREIVKLVKGTKRELQAWIQSDQVRISAKKKDDLQAVIELLRESDFGIDMQFVNYR